MTISVLLVEDHQIVREGTRQLLELHQDMQIVGEASDGLEAVSLAGILQPDVIVMDVRLPKLNGVDATRAITTRNPGIKVLILSAYEDDSYVFPLLDAGASGYLLKTSSSIELASAIRLVFAGQMALSPRISTKIVNRLGGRHSYRNEDMPRGLTEREMDVLKAAAHGKSNKEIALNLGITSQTVQVHLRNIFVKLDVNSRSEAIAHAIKHGWITLESPDE
ncbi:MAG TPA: DNA-binding response regulator [Anaerolineaceae bacterium]|nr:DNA-binding response regulator [Anaerolineaceae bacterium]